MSEGKYIRFAIAGQKPKTLIWDVVAKEGDVCLGKILWFGRWRGYAFFPRPEMIFERSCLRDIADFIEYQNTQQRQRAKA